LLAMLEAELDEVAKEEDEQQQEDDDVEIQQRQHDEVRRHRELRGPQRELERGRQHQHHQHRADDEQVALALALVAGDLGERAHWLRLGVRRLDWIPRAPAASPVMRATHEFWPFNETSARTRT